MHDAIAVALDGALEVGLKQKKIDKGVRLRQLIIWSAVTKRPACEWRVSS